jgi:quercetin dioxygenase-like cupin family protein
MNQSLAVLLLTLGLPLLVFGSSSGSGEVEITSEPSHHIALENEYVRLFEVSVAPHTATEMHRHHHDYVYVTLGDAWISNEVEGRDPVEAKLSDGQTRFTAGNFAHVARNLANTPFRNVTIELLQDEKKRGQPSRWKKDSGEDTGLGMHRTILFEKDGVRVSEVQLDPRSSLPKDPQDGAVLLVAVSDLELGSNADGKGSAGKLLHAGDFWWSDIPIAVMNAGVSTARFVLLEF